VPQQARPSVMLPYDDQPSGVPLSVEPPRRELSPCANDPQCRELLAPVHASVEVEGGAAPPPQRPGRRGRPCRPAEADATVPGPLGACQVGAVNLARALQCLGKRKEIA